MATVEVSFTPLPAHVRTARLVALAMARRVGVADSLLDEIRLAVGEACSRAVGVHAECAPTTPVVMRLSDGKERFAVEVTDVGPLDEDPQAASFGSVEAAARCGTAGEALDALPSGFGLVVIGGLVEEVVVTADDRGTHVTMAWPAPPGGARPERRAGRVF
jgi:serine/threonine-protein kinase RsbW